MAAFTGRNPLDMRHLFWVPSNMGWLSFRRSLLDGVPMLDTTDLVACNRYRLAYGHAAGRMEMSRFDHAWGRDFARRIDPERIRDEVHRQCPTMPRAAGDPADDQADVEMQGRGLPPPRPSRGLGPGRGP